MRKLLVVTIPLLFLQLSSGWVLAIDYYVSTTGSDSAPGGRTQPWETIEKVNSTHFQPGDRILFEGGRTFQGTLEFDREDSGTAERPVVLTSYGSGRAIVDGGNGRALEAKGCNYLSIRELKFVGSGRKTGNTETGVYLADAEGIEVNNIEVTGFRGSGLGFSGLQDARITHVYAHNNGFAGISGGGRTSSRVYIGHCLAENNPGDPSILTNHSGNGIVVGQIRDSLIEYCEARYNGWDMPRKGNGPVGIWAWDADRITIQYCVSHHNRSTGTDGGGFDFDGGVRDSILQYNYSHDNHGSGYLICQFGGASAFRDNVVRYNISQDDGLTNHNAGIYVWVGGASMESTLVHNNTVFNSKGAAVGFGVAEGYKGKLPELTFYNNIFVAGEDQIEGGAEKGRFVGNLYWAMGDGGFSVDGYKNFDEWVAATGQEKIGDRVVGLYVDPLLKKNGSGLLTDPDLLTTLTEYQLEPDSPAIDAGLDLLKQFGIDPGRRDFYGALLPQNGKYDIGACELGVRRAGGR